MKRRLMWGGIALLCIVVGVVYLEASPDQGGGAPSSLQGLIATEKTLILNDHTVSLEIVETPESRNRGLSGRKSLAKDSGMLFSFPEDGKYGIWMKDMQFSIDVLWLALDGTIVDIRENVSPTTYPMVFSPKIPARFVLELPAGSAKDYSVSIGDVARF